MSCARVLVAVVVAVSVAGCAGGGGGGSGGKSGGGAAGRGGGATTATTGGASAGPFVTTTVDPILAEGATGPEVVALQNRPGVFRSPLLYRSQKSIDADGAGPAWRSDPWGQAGTSLSWPGGDALDPLVIPYFVLPIGFETAHAEARRHRGDRLPRARRVRDLRGPWPARQDRGGVDPRRGEARHSREPGARRRLERRHVHRLPGLGRANAAFARGHRGDRARPLREGGRP